MLLPFASEPGDPLLYHSAMKPPSLGVRSKWGRAVLYATGEKMRTSKLFPCAALKVFRRGRPSGNLLLGGSKVGQREPDFFAHCLCTSMTERMPRVVKKPAVRRSELIRCAQEFFYTRGYESTSVNDIVTALGIAKGTFYYYFDSKLAILEAMAADLHPDG